MSSNQLLNVSSIVTYYVEYDDGKKPESIGAKTQILGGRLSAIAWHDEREAVKDKLRNVIMSNVEIDIITPDSVREDVDDYRFSTQDLIFDICDEFDLWDRENEN